MRDTRPAAVAGRFYPAERRDLHALVDQLLQDAPTGDTAAPAAMVPHAGLIYSGACAARVLARLDIPPVVVILSPNHTGQCGRVGTASAWCGGAFETPLGPIEVDQSFASALCDASPLVVDDPSAHQWEHGIEVELPFLASLAPQSAIVPMVINWDDWDSSRQLGESLGDLIRSWDRSVMMLISSDMNHFESATVADAKDKLALQEMQRLDGKRLLKTCRRNQISMCGRAPAAVVLAAMDRLGGGATDLVDYRNSGWVTGDLSSVVSYAGVVIQGADA